MRLVVIQDYLRGGGTEAQTLALLAAAREAGHDATLLTFRPGGALAGRARELGVRWEVLQPFDARVNGWAPGLVARLRRLQPERILLMGREANGKGARLAAAFPGVPRIATLRTGRALPRRYREGLRVATTVFVNSQYAAQRVRELGVAAERIHCVYNPLLRRFDPAGAETERRRIRAELGTEPGVPVLLTVAAFRPGKRHLDYLKAAAEHLPRDLPWEIWLLGSGSTFDRTRAAAQKLWLRPRVRFLGFQPDPRPYYAAADLAVLPSLEESFPNFLIEAQAAALPVVAFDIAGVQETFLPEQSGHLIPTADFPRLAQTAWQLALDPARARSFGHCGQAFILERCDPEARLRETLGIVQRSKVKGQS
ncbi:MAG: glycosyltransferase [Verrucomicrobiota bacterium]